MIDRDGSQRDSLAPAPALFSGRLEPEAALDSVVILEVHVPQAVIGGVAPALRRLAHVGGRAGYRGEDGLLQGGRFLGGPHVGGHVGLGDRGYAGPDPYGALALLDREGDRCPLYRDHLADQLREVRQRSPEFAGEDVQQRLLLLVCGLVVHERGHFPVALEDVAGEVGKADEGQARDVHAVNGALVDVVGHYGVAGAVVGVLANPAGTQHVAVADLQYAPFQLIGHFACLLPPTLPWWVIVLIRI